MSDISIFLNTSIISQKSSTLTGLGNICLSPVRYLFKGRTVRFVQTTSEYHEIVPNKRNLLKTILAIIFIVPGLLIGSVLKGLSYISKSVCEDHKTYKNWKPEVPKAEIPQPGNNLKPEIVTETKSKIPPPELEDLPGNLPADEFNRRYKANKAKIRIYEGQLVQDRNPKAIVFSEVASWKVSNERKLFKEDCQKLIAKAIEAKKEELQLNVYEMIGKEEEVAIYGGCFDEVYDELRAEFNEKYHVELMFAGHNDGTVVSIKYPVVDTSNYVIEKLPVQKFAGLMPLSKFPSETIPGRQAKVIHIDMSQVTNTRPCNIILGSPEKPVDLETLHAIVKKINQDREKDLEICHVNNLIIYGQVINNNKVMINEDPGIATLNPNKLILVGAAIVHEGCNKIRLDDALKPHQWLSSPTRVYGKTFVNQIQVNSIDEAIKHVPPKINDSTFFKVVYQVKI